CRSARDDGGSYRGGSTSRVRRAGQPERRHTGGVGENDRIDPTKDWKGATEAEAAAYEGDAVALGESRPDWLVKAVAPADDDDTMLDLVAPSNGEANTRTNWQERELKSRA